MTGAFYGSLSASASVFVAILTALLVNNYVQIKADRRQLTQRINEKEGQLEGLRDDRDEYQQIVDQIQEEKEQEFREEAEDNIDDFISEHLEDDFHHAIENLTVDDLYQELLDYEDCEDNDELEDSEEHQHHWDVLEDRFDQIKEVILNRTVQEFASRHEGDGRELFEDREERHVDDDEEVPDIVQGMRENYDPLQLDEFKEKYKEEYDLQDLNDRTEELLEEEYDDVVDKDFGEDSSFAESISAMDQNVASTLSSALAAAQSDIGTEPSFAPPDMGIDQRERRHERARDNLIQTKSEIESLERDKQDLERQKQRLNPEDLTTTLFSNAVTIFLSVVIPIFAYLLFVTNTTLTVPNWLWIITYTEVNVFLSWLIGLIVVFDSIHARINDHEPRVYRLYKWIRNRLSRN